MNGRNTNATRQEAARVANIIADVLLAAVTAVRDLDGCMDLACTEPGCWLGGMSRDEREAVRLTIEWIEAEG